MQIAVVSIHHGFHIGNRKTDIYFPTLSIFKFLFLMIHSYRNDSITNMFSNQTVTSYLRA